MEAGALRIRLHNGTLFTDRAAQERVFGDLPDVVELHGQEARRHAFEALEQRLAHAAAAHLVHEHAEFA